jgi:hypothetical protein
LFFWFWTFSVEPCAPQCTWCTCTLYTRWRAKGWSDQTHRIFHLCEFDSHLQHITFKNQGNGQDIIRPVAGYNVGHGHFKPGVSSLIARARNQTARRWRRDMMMKHCICIVLAVCTRALWLWPFCIIWGNENLHYNQLNLEYFIQQVMHCNKIIGNKKVIIEKKDLSHRHSKLK